jgi:hypothetical protein
MERAIFLSRGDSWTTNLERALSFHFALVVHNFRTNSIDQASEEIRIADLAIVDVSIDDQQMRTVLEVIRRARMQQNLKPALLCISRVNRGPRFQYQIERMGARFAYGQ